MNLKKTLKKNEFSKKNYDISVTIFEEGEFLKGTSENRRNFEKQKFRKIAGKNEFSFHEKNTFFIFKSSITFTSLRKLLTIYHSFFFENLPFFSNICVFRCFS